MARRTLHRTNAPRYPDFPVEEYRRRVVRAREVMREDGLDALLLARNVNVLYMTGTRFVFVGKDAPMAFTPQTTAIVTKSDDVYCQRFGPFDTDNVPLDTTASSSLELYDDETELVGILKDYGVRRGDRVGTEWGPGLCLGINPLKFLSIQERVAKELGAELVDATTSIWKLMARKSQLEVDRMRIAARAAARAMDRILDTVELGMSQLEVSRRVSMFMLEEGGDQISHAQVAHQDGHSRFGSCDALDRPLEPGYVNLDIGCRYRHYGSDINRGVFLGREPTSAERRLYECRKGVDDLLDRVIKPGVAIDDVLAQARQYVEDAGYVLPENHGGLFLGHSIGLENYQHPGLMASSLQPEFQNASGQVILEPGMLFTYEMPVVQPGLNAFFNIEDDVVVTETGVENLSSDVSRDLRVR